MTTPDKLGIWKNLTRTHNLTPAAHSYDKLVPWAFGDFCFKRDADYFQTVTRLRKAGFNGMKLDSAEMWISKIQQLEELGVIPRLGKGMGAAEPAGDVGGRAAGGAGGELSAAECC